MIYTLEQSIKTTKDSLLVFRKEKRLNLQSTTVMNHTPANKERWNLRWFTRRNKYRIPLIFFTLIIPHLMPFSLSLKILYQGRNFVRERLKISSSC